MQKNYEFRKEMLEVHRADILDAAYQPEAGMLKIDDTFHICIHSDADRVVTTAALDLQDYFFTSLQVSVAVKRCRNLSEAPENAIVIGTWEQWGQSWQQEKIGASYMVDVEKTGVRVMGFDSRGCAQGCYQLEDRMNRIRAPFLSLGHFHFAPAFSPRMVHSGYQMDRFPDAHLSAIAHAGMDAIIIFVKDVNMTPTGHLDFNELIYRAGKYGLDVYAYSYYESSVHPDAPNAYDYYNGIYGKLFRECPGFKGVILVGESVEFPSEDPRVSKKRYYDNMEDGIPTGIPTAGWFPCSDYHKWVSMLQRVIYAQKPDADIVFWTYNWGYAPEQDRLALIDSLPAGISLLVTFDVFAQKMVNGLNVEATDYTIALPGPSQCFRSEAARAKERGLRLYTQANSGGLTWDIGVIPYEPFPFQWMERYRAMLEAKKEYGLCGVMESHHYGFWPSFISQIEKIAFTAASEPEEPVTVVAKEHYGVHWQTAMQAWDYLSQAIRYYPVSNEDQYGPFRIGPAYPLVFRVDVKIPTVPYAHFGGNAICFTDYACDAMDIITRYGEIKTGMIQQRIPKELEALHTMRGLLQKGRTILEELSEKLQGCQRADNDRLINLVRFMENCVTTTIHVKQWNQCRWQIRNAADPEILLGLFQKMLAIGQAEIENAEQTIPLVEADSRLGWEPSMEYICDKAHLEWKLRQVRQVLQMELPRYMAGVQQTQTWETRG